MLQVIKPTPKQLEAHHALLENTIVLYGGAVRGSKSYWGCMEIISMCFQFPGSRWLMCRESWQNILGKLLVTFTQNFLDKGFDNHIKVFNKETYTLTWKNGSQIVFMPESFDSDKELNRFKGLEINGAFIDEVNEIREETFDKIIERSGSWFHAPGCPIKILMTCNPTNNWVKTRFYDAWKKNELPKGIAYIPAKITDNPYVPDAYLESLKMLPKYKYMVYVEGDWDVQLKIGGEFYKCFELDKHVGRCTYNPNLPLHVSWDDNVNPYLPAGVFQIEGMEFRMIKEFAGVNPSNTIKAVCREIIREYGNIHKGGMFIYGDATANKEDTKIEKGMNFYRIVMQELKQFRPQSRVLTHNPSVMQRGDFINTILEKNLYDIRITIDESCKHAINDFIGTKEAADGTKLKELTTDPVTKARYQKYGHFTDLTDYCIVSAFGKEYDKFLRGGEYVPPLVGRSAIRKNSY